MRSVLVGLFFAVTAQAVCSPAVEDVNGTLNSSLAAWPFGVGGGNWPSCASSKGGVNDMGSTPKMCANDPASVYIQVRPGQAECLVAHAEACKIPMHDFASLDYDFSIQGCNGIWGAPMWMTPDKWQWGAGSGEIDSLEFCPRNGIFLNFAGGGHQTGTKFDINNANGHVTVRKDQAGIVTITACAQSGGQCPAPSYTNCASCQQGSNSFACWCNEGTNPKNIYGSGGCQNGGDCMWTLVSDVWNGVRGDGGYQACMNAVANVVAQHQPNLNSKCQISVEHLKIRGEGGGALKWPAGTPASCDAFN